ncbi:MAG: hypothetical protein GWM98_15080, partial [Nitrospinaceae bacterium]|nr:hypothetical protein [Nitrospinaceae bacterium]NIR55558.1 hypothetical protein [Nitrospinaceae bacterium]NIS85992.1 hypothetical protein [Nitrospinaceae bacterium]NIT82838.1 hypothetical protein [Nitrospinaceae bacterium]NIU45040.1 hypothetical protein [Nitrospinaceae bacterium]
EEISSQNKLYGSRMAHPAQEVKSVLNVAGRNWFLVWQGSTAFKNGPKTIYAFWSAGSVLTLALFLVVIIEMMATRT